MATHTISDAWERLQSISQATKVSPTKTGNDIFAKPHNVRQEIALPTVTST